MKLSNYDLKRFKNVKLEPNEAIEKLDGLKICDESITQLEEIGFEHLQERYRTQNQALDYAIELVKRDEGMRVVKTESEGFIELQCPECYHEVLPLDEFCSSCGQRLERSDEE